MKGLRWGPGRAQEAAALVGARKGAGPLGAQASAPPAAGAYGARRYLVSDIRLVWHIMMPWQASCARSMCFVEAGV